MKQLALQQPEFRKAIVIILIVFVVAILSLTGTPASALASSDAGSLEPKTTAQEPKPTDVREVTLAVPIERELAGGQAHSYRVVLEPGQYMRVVVEQKGIDVMVRLLGPDGQKITEVDSPNGTQGPEPVSVIAESAGEYRLKVEALDKKAVPGRYQVKIEELREPTASDRDRLAAEKMFGEAEDLRSQGTAESLRKSIEKHIEASRLLHAVGDSYLEAYSLTSIGLIYWQLGDSEKALEYHNQALPLRRAVGDRGGEAITLSNIGVAYQNLGQLQKALVFFNQALPLNQAAGDKKGEAITLNNTAVINNRLGNFEKALELHRKVLSLRRAIEDRRGEAITLSNIGTVYTQLGDLQKALEYHQQSLSLQRVVGDRQNQATTLQSLGVIYGRLGDFQKALECLDEALVLSKAVGDRRIQAYELNSIGELHRRLGSPERALDHYQQSLALARAIEDRSAEIQVLNNIGYVYYELGEPKKAWELHNQALQLSRSISDQLGEVSTLLSIARAESKLGDLTQARAHIEAALNLIEFTRVKVGSQALRTSFFASKQDYYEFYIALLMKLHQQEPSAGHDAVALQVSERARARSLLETLAEARADIRQGVDAGLLERERSVQQQLNAKSELLTRLLRSKHTNEQEATARKEVEGVLTDYQDVAAQIRAKSPRYAALTQPQPLSLKEIQQLLDKETLLLEYTLGEERSYLWAVTPTSIKSYELPRRAEIETVTQQLYKLVTGNENRGLQAQAEAATALSALLLGPVAGELGQKRLVIVSDGAIQYVPFAILPLPVVNGRSPAGSSRTRSNKEPAVAKYQPLIVKHEIVQLPSASVLGVSRLQTAGRTPAANTVAVLADPVFQSDDPRVRNGKMPTESTKAAMSVSEVKPQLESDLKRSAWESGLQDLQRLPFTRREAEAIVAFAPAGKSLKAIDFDASHATVIDDKLARYRIVHFATHGLLNSVHPELSGIVLSLVDEAGRPQDGFLRLHEIYNLNLPAELVVLSGCQTALGKQVRGEGLVGLTRGFLYAGTARLVVSLWEVNDEATAELMKRFYEGMLMKGMRPAAALRNAQLAMWKSKWWKAPYYWGGFVMQGEWR